jgi:hypothetical protein
MRSGFIPLGSWLGVEIRLHWSAFVSAVAFSVFRPWPVFWGAFLGLLFVHALGHAAVGKLCGLRLTRIAVDGLGGEAHWRTETTKKKGALIAWGGVAAQLVLLVATLAAMSFEGGVATPPEEQWLSAWTSANAALLALHLIPFRPFDGRDAWKLIPLLLRRRGPSTSWRVALWEVFRTPCDEVFAEPLADERLSLQVKAQLDQIAADVRGRSPRRSTNRP